MRRKLTDKQTRLLAYLQRAIAREGQAPSLRQAASDLGVSHAAVAQSLRILEDKGYVKREGRYSRTIHILNRARETAGHHRWREIPVVGQVTAGLPMYAQEEWAGSVVLDASLYRGQTLFALRIRGDSMQGAGIYDGDLLVVDRSLEPVSGSIVIASLDGELTVKEVQRRGNELQ